MVGTRYAFTGPSRLTARERDHAATVVQGLQEGTEFSTGCASGWDVSVALAALRALPDAKHRVIIPAASYDELSVGIWTTLAVEVGCRTEVLRMPLTPEPYRRRNEMLVAYCDVLVAAVHGTTFYRSGEFMTVNIARRAGVPVQFVDLSTLA